MSGGGRPYTTDGEVLRRFDPRKTIFARIAGDPSAPFYGQSVYARSAEKFAGGEPGCSRPDYEEVLASWTAHDYFRGAFSAEKLGEPDSVMAEPEHGRYEFPSPAEASDTPALLWRPSPANLALACSSSTVSGGGRGEPRSR